MSVWERTHQPNIPTSTRLEKPRLAAGRTPDRETVADLEALLQLLTPDLADAAVVRLVEGPRLAQLLVVAARAGLAAPDYFVDPLVQVGGCACVLRMYVACVERAEVLKEAPLPAHPSTRSPFRPADRSTPQELMRGGGAKLPATTPHLLAELATALAAIGWRERPLWLAIVSAAKVMAPSPALGGPSAAGLGRQQQQHREQQERQAEGGGSRQRRRSDISAAPLFDDDFDEEEEVGYETDDDDGQLEEEEGEDDEAVSDRAAGPPRHHHHHHQQQQQQQQQQQPPANFGRPQRPSYLLAQDLARLAGALSRVGLRDDDLLDGLGAAAAQKAPLMRLEDLAEIAGAYARFAYRPAAAPEFVEALGAALAARLAPAAAGGSSSSSSGGGGGNDDPAAAWWERQGLSVAEMSSSSGSSSGEGGYVFGVDPARDAVKITSALAALTALTELGLRSRAPLQALCAQLVQSGARLAPPQLATLLRVCGATNYRAPRVLRRLVRAVCAARPEAWRSEEVAAAARAFGEMRRWDAAAVSALATAALVSTGSSSGSGSSSSGRGGRNGGRAASQGRHASSASSSSSSSSAAAAAAGSVGHLADVVWGFAAATAGGRGSGNLPPPVPAAAALVCEAAAAAAERQLLAQGGALVLHGGGTELPGGMTTKQQADLVWGLRRLGQEAAARRVVAAAKGRGGDGQREKRGTDEEAALAAGRPPAFD
jgi:hypothetical protein